MVLLGTTSLPLLGARDYLHSTDVFHFFCRATAAAPGGLPCSIASFKFLRETARNGAAMLLDEDEEAPPAARDPVAVIRYADASGAARRFVLSDDGPRAEQRRTEPPRRFARPQLSGDFSGSTSIDDVSDADVFFTTLVEANKALHAETLRRRGEDEPAAFRFIYCENVALNEIIATRGPAELRYAHRGVRESGGRKYTLNLVTVSSVPASPIRICFAF